MLPCSDIPSPIAHLDVRGIFTLVGGLRLLDALPELRCLRLPGLYLLPLRIRCCRLQQAVSLSCKLNFGLPEDLTACSRMVCLSCAASACQASICEFDAAGGSDWMSVWCLLACWHQQSRVQLYCAVSCVQCQDTS